MKSDATRVCARGYAGSGLQHQFRSITNQNGEGDSVVTGNVYGFLKSHAIYPEG